MSYNMTSEDFVHKYTVNIPLYIWRNIKVKTAKGTSRYNGHVSPYINEILEADIRKWLEAANSEFMTQSPCPDPARKYHGFQFKLGNPFRLKTFKEKVENRREYREKENS